MESSEQLEGFAKPDRQAAFQSYQALTSIIKQLHSADAEIRIEKTEDKLSVPVHALHLLGSILKKMSQGKEVSVVAVTTAVTTQQAAELIGCSRPHLVRLLEQGKITYAKVGRHRRIKLEDVLSYQKQMKIKQKQHLIDIMHSDEELGLYDL